MLIKLKNISNKISNKGTLSMTGKAACRLVLLRLGTVLLLIIMIGLLSFSGHDKLRITLIDVSQGDGIFIRTASQTNFLIDGGSSDVDQAGTYRMVPFLKASGIGRIDYIIITHMDYDHVSGIMELIDPQSSFGIKVKHVIIPYIYEKEKEFEEIITLAEASAIPIIYMKAGDVLKEKEFSLTCLHPKQNYQWEDSNEYSTVLSLNYKEFDMLLTGDVEGKGEEAVMKEIKHTYEVLKVAHHGSRNSTPERLLELMKPDIALISCGRDNQYGHPHEELLERLEKYHVTCLSTSEWGAITVETDGETYQIDTFLSYR